MDPSVDDPRYGLRLAWAASVRNVYQAAVGELSFGDPTGMDAAVRRLKRCLPPPVNDVEAIYLRQSLAIFVDRGARVLHERFHANFARPMCTVSPPSPSEAAWVSTRPIEQLLDETSDAYGTWFARHHALPMALRAASILQERFVEPLTIVQLAQAVGASRTILCQHFTRTFGLTPSDYLARVRVRAGLSRLRLSRDSVDTIALGVGYRSENKFYGRVRTYTGLRPSEVRKLEDAAFENMIERCVPLMVRRQCSASHPAAPAYDALD